MSRKTVSKYHRWAQKHDVLTAPLPDAATLQAQLKTTLPVSRHSYVEFVFDQEVDTWLRCHRRAFEWFGGVVRRVVLDNLKAAIVHAALYDPVVQRAYRECAEHYGFLISRCRPRTPEHK